VSALDEVLARLKVLPEDEKRQFIAGATAQTRDMVWVPNPGPQEIAFFSDADETFYGGQAGGGKTDLAVGLAVTVHRRSLILRRINKDAVKIVSRIEEVLGTRNGYNGQLQRWRINDKQIDIAGCEQESDKQRFKGDPHDLIVFDEGTDFLESQYRFIIGWNRSAVPGQRCRVLVTSNPPTTAEGLWVIKYWAPWLDDTHPNPAAPGELRWFTTIGGEDVEVDGPGPHMVDGEEITARSRTFIPAALADNPDLAATNYASVLASLPEELRRAYRDGDFSVGLKDADFQVIPTDWIKAAQARWTPRPPEGVMMTAMGFDPAGGGSDAAELAYRYGGWYGPLITATGADTADGSSMAAAVMKHRRDACPVVVDMGGGYGGAVTMRLADNKVEFVKFNGATGSSARTKDGSLAFVNKRAEAYWRFREELDPDQPGGSVIALPPDPELRADLAAPTWSLKPNGIVLESKEEIRKRLGRSPGKADAVVYALDAGQQAVKRQQKRGAFGQHPKVTLGYGHMKQNYGR
jgi:hypothetical protein